MSRLAQKPRGLLELQGEPDPEAASQLGRLARAWRRRGGSLRPSELARESAATIRIGTSSSCRIASRRRKWSQWVSRSAPARAASPLARRPRPAPDPAIKQAACLVDRVLLEEGLQLGQPELDGRPAAALECRQIGLERGAQGRGLADAGFHGSSARSVACHRGSAARSTSVSAAGASTTDAHGGHELAGNGLALEQVAERLDDPGGGHAPLPAAIAVAERDGVRRSGVWPSTVMQNGVPASSWRR